MRSLKNKMIIYTKNISKNLKGKKMSKAVIIILGIIMIIMGVLGLIPGMFSLNLAWYEVAKIVIGAIALIIGLLIKKRRY
jgi:uncharacterized membrane-anchored protein